MPTFSAKKQADAETRTAKINRAHVLGKVVYNVCKECGEFYSSLEIDSREICVNCLLY